MRDIAERVGVSIKSVSRVLNGESGVSAATTRCILDVADELGFRRNDLARGLRQRDRTGSVGVVLQRFSTWFFDNLLRGVDEVAERRDCLVITAGSRDADRERNTLLALSSRRVDGLIIEPLADDHAFLRPEQAGGMPLVFVDRPPQGIAADTVLADDAGGAHAATAALIARGHRRIAVLGAAANLHTVAERVRGYRAAHRAARLPVDNTLLVLGQDGSDSAGQELVRLLGGPAPPSAVFALNSVCAIGAARALRELGLQHRIALVGFDDFALADLLDPPITVVAHEVNEMGRVAAERLFAQIDGLAAAPRTIVMPTALLERGSGEIPGPGLR
jgi:LacI family transcriptional regulator